MNIVKSFTYCLVIIYCARVIQSDSCAVTFRGASSVKLSAEAMDLVSSSIGNYSVDYTQHTFDLWVSPNQFVGDEQSVFQTGQVHGSEGTSWAVELKIKLTIWQKGQSKPSSSVLYVDVWTMSHEEHAWSKTRHYIILAEDSYPWVHVVYTPALGDHISINGKDRRLDQYATIQSELNPQEQFAIGGQFKGAVADVRVWKVSPSTQINLQNSDCNSILGASMLFYFPLNECKGDSFSGYFNGEPVCALMYGSYDTTSMWTHDSPEVGSCTSVTSDKCSSATRAATPQHNNSNTNNKSSDLFLRLPSFNFGFKLVLLVPVLVLGIVLLRRNRNTTAGESLQV